MSNLPLGDYLQRIEGLIEEERLTEAAAHCRHILEQHPRYIEAYRLLGKALLEQNQYSDAADLFQRLLSAAPDDLIAHVGLAVAYKADQLFRHATWHMERAFELDPYNGVIQDELRGLYTLGEMPAPKRFVLTKPAVARLHSRSKMYPQAIQALRELLAEDDSRIDLQLLLAESLWWHEQIVDTERVCRQIIEKLPNCITANAILADVWLTSGRVEDAEPYLHRLQQLVLIDQVRLDTETAVGQALTREGAPRIPKQFIVTELKEMPDLSGETDTGVSWMDALEELESREEDPLGGWLNVEKLETGELEQAEAEETLPDWLVELGESGEEEEQFAELAEETDVDLEDVLGFLNDTGMLGESPSPTTPTTESADTLDWFSDAATDTLLESERQMAGTEGEKSTGFTDWLEQQKELELAGVTLDEADAALDELLVEAEAELEQENLPDWLRDDVAVEDEVVHMPAQSVVEQMEEPKEKLGWETEADEMDWLTEMPAEATSPTPEKVDVPDWLSEMADGTSTDDLVMGEAIDLAEDRIFQEKVPDWMQEKEEVTENAGISPVEAASIDELLNFADSLQLPPQDTSPLDWLDETTTEPDKSVVEEPKVDLGEMLSMLDGSSLTHNNPLDTGDLDTDELVAEMRTKLDETEQNKPVEVTNLAEGDLLDWLDELGDTLAGNDDMSEQTPPE